jgi:DNA invertase Pin-like site-specific DNA recombinase
MADVNYACNAKDIKPWIAYYRVSTDKQGTAGLGMEAQRNAVSSFIGGRGEIITEFVETESGKRHRNRPQLLAALEECRKRRAVLIIAKLDRLARNVAFIANLMESNVEFIAADMPEANRLTIHILAAVAEHEARIISDRTKAALAVAKGRGTLLGNPRYGESIAGARAARDFVKPAPEVMRLMVGWKSEGMSLRGIARELNRLGIRSHRGCQWYAYTVSQQVEAHNACNNKAETLVEFD